MSFLTRWLETITMRLQFINNGSFSKRTRTRHDVIIRTFRDRKNRTDRAETPAERLNAVSPCSPDDATDGDAFA